MHPVEYLLFLFTNQIIAIVIPEASLHIYTIDKGEKHKIDDYPAKQKVDSMQHFE
jgi:hypothetical protein